jgi:NADPH:quinone reductase-like Zn-dependent oxidoreductase
MARALTISARGESPTISESPSPEPGPGQIRVAVQAASVNGIDAYVAGGYVWDAMPHRFPVVLGRDFAGTVEAVGAGVTRLRVGDLVAGVVTGMDLYLGAIAEKVVLDEGGVVGVPDGVTAVQAAAVGLAGVSARDLVDTLALTADDIVLISGATGGVGAFTVQLAAATGATVLATARPDAQEFVSGLGAHTVIDYTADLTAAVAEAAPDGVTAVAHAAGDAASLAKTLRPGGRLASLLGATAEQVGRDDITVTPVGAEFSPEKFRALLDAVAAGQIQVPVGQTFGLDDAAQALGAFGEPKQGKLVITLA